MDFLNNTEIVVGIGFLIFLAVLGYFKVPGLILGKLDDRAVKIRADLDEARALREEAQALLASFERKQKEVAQQAEDIVAAAKLDAEKAAAAAKEEIQRSVVRRIQTATDQIEAAEKAAVRQIKDRAVAIAVAAASDVIRDRIRPEDTAALVNSSIVTIGAKLH